MKILIAILGCNATAYAGKALAQTETWVRDAVELVDVRLFVGRGNTLWGDAVSLPCSDAYNSRIEKVRCLCVWALVYGYDLVFKTDDDTYVDVRQLLASIPPVWADYVGTFVAPSGGYPSWYASGFAYWLSRKAMLELQTAPATDWAEDRWVGNALARGGIRGWEDVSGAYKVLYPPHAPEVMPPMRSHTLGAVLAEYPAELIYRAHKVVHDWHSEHFRAVPYIVGPWPDKATDEAEAAAKYAKYWEAA